MKKEYGYAAVSIFMWSTTAAVSKLLLGSFNSMQIMTVTSLFAFVFLFLLNLLKGRRTLPSETLSQTVRRNLSEWKQYTLRDYVQMFAIGALGIFLYHLLLYLGIDRMEQASQAFIINYLWPIMTVLFACLIMKEKLTVRKSLAMVLSFVGVIIVTTGGKLSGIGADNLIGALYCVLAAISYGLFSVLNKHKGYNKYFSMMIYYLAALIISLVYTVVTEDWFTLDLPQTAGMLWSGIFTTALAFTTWALALEKGDTAKISNLAYLTPFLSLIWTWILLGEDFDPFSLIGLLFIVAGIFVQIKRKKSKA